MDLWVTDAFLMAKMVGLVQGDVVGDVPSTCGNVKTWSSPHADVGDSRGDLSSNQEGMLRLFNN